MGSFCSPWNLWCPQREVFLFRSKYKWRCSVATSPERFKKNVAIWVGYVGTDYKGLQSVEGAQTVEDELQEAIYKYGGISESNYKHLDKLKWKRSSRTDKGVHSLCTVITMKLEIPVNAWLNDVDGIQIANSFNTYLPTDISVFGVVPVTKSFNARTSCYSRTYVYYLPTGCIGIRNDSKPEEVEARLERFRSILKLMEGRHAFHNYTVRRLYRTSQRAAYKQNSSRDRNKAEETEVDDQVEAEVDEKEETDENVLKEATELESSSRSRNPAPRSRAYWVDESENTRDVVNPSHYRKVTECTCDGIENFGGVVSGVRVRVTGESFMVHQIRKMVGTAVAVARGILPEDVIPISLCPGARVVLPRAPPDGLVLSSNCFFPFKGGYVHGKGRTGYYFSKLGIEVSDSVARRMHLFWTENLAPVMAASMNERESPWKVWLETLESSRLEESEMNILRKSF